MKVSLLIPAYNERENIPELLETTREFFEKNAIQDWEMIVINDGSTDGTGELLEELKPRYPFLKVAHHRRNQGVSAGLLTGFLHSSGEILVYYAADMQFSLEDVKRMVETMEREGVDIVAGKKVGKYEKKLVSKIYNWLSAKLFDLPVTDLNSMKAMRREIFEEIPMRKDWHRYIIPLAYHKGFKVTEIPVTLYPRRHGDSKYKGVGRILIGFLDLIAVKFQITFMQKPMLFFGTLGLFSMAGGVVVGLVSLYLRFILHHGYRPLAYLVMLLILMGLILFAIGFLGELIAAQNDRMELFLRQQSQRRT